MKAKKVIYLTVILATSGFAANVMAAGKPNGAGQGAGGRFDRLKSLDADNDGSVTSAEFLKKQHERFTRLDLNKDGSLSPDEVVSSRRGAASAEVRAERLMKRHDANADGHLTKEEFEAGRKAWFAKRDKNGDGILGEDEQARRFAHRGRQGRTITLESVLENAAKRFNAMDVNADGSVDAAEISNSQAERQAYRVRRAMHRLDANGDGAVSEDEFLAQSRTRFGWMDLDSDGRITSADLPPQARVHWEAR